MNEFIKKLIEGLEEQARIEEKIAKCKTEGHPITHQYAANCLKDFKRHINQLAEEYNNDGCEWFKYDYRTMAPKNHDVENPYWRIPENMDKLNFCPYCGKEIKVIE